METQTKEVVREPAMARDFFKSTFREGSPQYRWARRSRRSTTAEEELKPGSHSPSPAPVPHIANLSSSRSKRVAAGLASPRSAAACVGPGSLKLAPGSSVGAKLDGAASPRGPLEFPASPASSPGSAKDAASPAARLTSLRSRRSPSPSRGPPLQPPRRLTSPAPNVAAPAHKKAVEKSVGGGFSGVRSPAAAAPAAQGERPAVPRAPYQSAAAWQQTLRASPPRRAVKGWPTSKPVEAAAKDAVPTKAAAKTTSQTGARSATPFRRGLNAIKGRLFPDSRKAAAQEISRTQQALIAQHKVKPAASTGIKDSLVQRFTRALHRPAQSPRALIEAAPAAAPQDSPAVPARSAVSAAPLPSPRPLEAPKPLALPGAPRDELQPSKADYRLQAVDASNTPAREGPGLGKGAWLPRPDQELSPSSQACPEDAKASSAYNLEQREEMGRCDLELDSHEESAGAAGSGLEDGAGSEQASAGSGAWGHPGSSRAGEESPQDSSSESDSDQDGIPARPPLPLLSCEAPAAVPRYASWAQRVPPNASPAASWDSQSSTEFANTRRPAHVQRLLSSESSGSEQGSPRYGPSPLGSPHAARGAFQTASHLCEQDKGPATPGALPVLASLERPQPAASPPSPPSPLRQAEVPSPSSSSTLDALSWSSDEEAEEDRSARKRDMAAALRQLKSFKAGGDPARPTRPAPAVLQRSFTDPSAYQVVKRAPSPMRTLWRQASAAAATLEGPTSSAKRLGLAAAGRALSRTRDVSPCPPGLLASPRRLRPEASPQWVPAQPASLFDDGPRGPGSWGAGPRVAGGQAGQAGRASKTPGRARPVAAAAAFFRSFTPGRQRPQVL